MCLGDAGWLDWGRESEDEATKTFRTCSRKSWASQWCSGKESACQFRRRGRCRFDPGWGRSPGGGNSNPLQCSCPRIPMDRGARQATVHGAAKSWPQLCHCACTHTHTHRDTHTDTHTETHTHRHTYTHTHTCTQASCTDEGLVIHTDLEMERTEGAQRP